MKYTGQRILVLGLGATGLSLALWLRDHGAEVPVADTRESPPKLLTLKKRAEGIPLHLGAWSESLFRGIDLVAISPGININIPLVASARARGIPFVGDIELFARELAIDQKVIAITGSNGKSTVTALAGTLCASTGMRTGVAGNIRVPVLDALREAGKSR